MDARRAENRSVKDSIEAINSVQHNDTGFRIFHRYVDTVRVHTSENCFSYIVFGTYVNLYLFETMREKENKI